LQGLGEANMKFFIFHLELQGLLKSLDFMTWYGKWRAGIYRRHRQH